MIPTLNMTKIHRTPSPGSTNGVGGGGLAGQGSASRLHTGRQMSPRTPNVVSPRDATSSQPSAHLTRRAAEVAPVLEMNPLQCQNVSELQRKLVETAEWVIKLRYYYAVQLQERDQWLDGRLRDLEKFYADAVSAAVEARLGSAAAAAVSATSSAADNGAPATISTAKVGLSGAVHTGESERGSSSTPQRQRRPKHSSTLPHVASALSSLASSPQPSLPNTAQADTASVEPADGAQASGSATRARSGAPKQSAVVPIPQGRRTASASGVHRPPQRGDDATAAPRLAAMALATVDRGELRPTRAARSTAEADSSDAAAAARRRCPPAMSASRDTSGFVDTSGGPRLDVLAATVPATTRPGKSAALDATGSGYLAMSTNGASRRRSESSSSRKQYYTSSPRAGAAGLTAVGPTHSQYLEAGFGLSRDAAPVSSAASSPTDHAHGRTPRDGSSYVYLMGSSGNRSGRVYAPNTSARASQRSASRGLSGREKVKSNTVSAQSSPARTHAL